MSSLDYDLLCEILDIRHSFIRSKLAKQEKEKKFINRRCWNLVYGPIFNDVLLKFRHKSCLILPYGPFHTVEIFRVSYSFITRLLENNLIQRAAVMIEESWLDDTKAVLDPMLNSKPFDRLVVKFPRNAHKLAKFSQLVWDLIVKWDIKAIETDSILNKELAKLLITAPVEEIRLKTTYFDGDFSNFSSNGHVNKRLKWHYTIESTNRMELMMGVLKKIFTNLDSCSIEITDTRILYMADRDMVVLIDLESRYKMIQWLIEETDKHPFGKHVEFVVFFTFGVRALGTAEEGLKSKQNLTYELLRRLNDFISSYSIKGQKIKRYDDDGTEKAVVGNSLSTIFYSMIDKNLIKLEWSKKFRLGDNKTLTVNWSILYP